MGARADENDNPVMRHGSEVAMGAHAAETAKMMCMQMREDDVHADEVAVSKCNVNGSASR